MIALLLIFLSIIILIGIASIKVISQWERGVKFTLGKYSGIMKPGINFLVPILQTFSRVDIRQRTIDLPSQEVMTKDKVNLRIDGIVFFSVTSPEKSVLNVVDLYKQLTAKATSELKEITGKMSMSESLSQRDEIAKRLKEQLDIAVKENESGKGWGIEIQGVQINNLELPKELIRAMSKQAEAEREKEARITKADGEYEASKKFGEASKIYQQNPSAIRLRELQTYQEIGTEQNTLMIVIPENTKPEYKAVALSSGISKLSEKKNG